MSRRSAHLVIFAKEPRLGRVKRRLAVDVGLVRAWGFYRRTLRRVIARLGKDRRWRCWLAVTPDRAVYASGIWFPGGRIFGPKPRGLVIGQGPGDLGRRMGAVFKSLPPGPAVIVGTDIPGITAAHIAAAFRALGNHDAVFGPAADGGYWLVGLKRSPRVAEIFAGVRWSTEHALADTLANLPQDFRVAMLDTLEDVDDGGALARAVMP
ncbi:MAG: TIGR04282 family arsenosugar biosynthesis glycosyltransferase [Rhodospirillales bacterium]|nr:TIGR04282 family arsenosugar biosynthesis glycosyltransferase [Rhodospirillales bacterium]